MSEMTFIINDQSTGSMTPVVQVTIRENGDGTVTFIIRQLLAAGNYLGDLRGFFFDLANEAQVGHLNLIHAEMKLANGACIDATSTSAFQSNGSLSSVGSNSNNMNGLLGTDGGFDAGISIGTEGVGAKGDDVRGFEFTLGSDLTGGLSLADFEGVNFGARITSVGLDTNGDGIIDTARTGSVKMIEESAATVSANAGVWVDDDVFNGVDGGAGDNDNALNTIGVLAHSYSSGTVKLTGVQFPVGLGLTTTTLTDNLIIVSQNGTAVLKIEITDAANGAYKVTQLGPIQHANVAGENDLSFVVGYRATSSDGDYADGVLAINVDDAVVHLLATSDVAGSLTESASTLIDTGHVDFKAGDTATAALDSSQTTLSYQTAGGAAAPLPAGLSEAAIKAAFSVNSSGAWTYDASDPALDLDALAKDDTITLTYKVVVSDTDGDTATETVTIVITGTNDTPVLSASLASATFDDTSGDDTFLPVSGTLTTVDPDAGDTKAYSIDGGVATSASGFDFEKVTDYGTLFLNGTSGAYTFVPNEAAIEGLKAGTSISFDMKVTDGEGASDTETLTITINAANDVPTAPATNSVSMLEDQASSAIAIGAGDRDAGETLSYSVKTGSEPAKGSVSFNTALGTFVYTPNANANGSDSFTIVVTDADGATTEQVVSVTITPVNDAPSGTDGTITMLEDSSRALTAADFGLTDANDVPANTLAAVQISTLPAAGTLSYDGVAITQAEVDAGLFISAADLAAGKLVFTPAENANGTGYASFTFQVRDNGGTANGGVDLDATPNTITFNVTAVNDAPVLDASKSPVLAAVAEDAAAPVGAVGTLVSTLIDLSGGGGLDNASDVDSGAVTGIALTGTNSSNGTWYYSTDNGASWTAVGAVSASSALLLAADSSTRLYFQPNANFNGTVSDGLTFKAWDQTSGTNGGSADTSVSGGTTAFSSAIDTAAITVTPVNDAALIGGDDMGVVTEATAANPGDPDDTGTLTAADIDNPPNTFQPATGTTTYGSYTMSSTGQWTYLLDNNNSVVNALVAGAFLIDSFVVYSADGTAHTVQVRINGADDVIVVDKPDTYTGLDAVNDHDSDLGVGTSNSPLITGTNSGETINGRTGTGQTADTINALAGDDTVFAGDGGDTVYGGADSDHIYGGAGNDTLYGQAGDDFLYGEGNNDSLYGGSGDDTLEGGDNTDTLLNGGSGNDTILGGLGDDLIIGGYGADTLTGGGGNDTFRYVSTLDTNDIILDFMVSGSDFIDLSAIDADPTTLVNDALAWGGTTPTAHGAWYEETGGDTILYADTDGDAGTAEFMIALQGFSGWGTSYDQAVEGPPPGVIL